VTVAASVAIFAALLPPKPCTWPTLPGGMHWCWRLWRAGCICSCGCRHRWHERQLCFEVSRCAHLLDIGPVLLLQGLLCVVLLRDGKAASPLHAIMIASFRNDVNVLEFASPGLRCLHDHGLINIVQSQVRLISWTVLLLRWQANTASCTLCRHLLKHWAWLRKHNIWPTAEAHLARSRLRERWACLLELSVRPSVVLKEQIKWCS